MSKKTIRRAKTRDVAFTYRMGAGFPGDVNKAVGSRIEPCKMDTTDPVDLYGHGCTVNTSANSVRKFKAADTSLVKLYGVVVRPYPTQQTTGGMSASMGVGAPPTSGVVDVIREGSIIVKVVGTPTKDGAAYLWVAASTGSHVQGSFETSASSGNTILLSNARFNGPPDADGYAELQLWQRD